MLKIDMFGLKDFPVNVIEDLFDGISEHFIDKVTECSVRRCFMIHKIHEAEVDLTIVLQLTKRDIPIRHKSE